MKKNLLLVFLLVVLGSMLSSCKNPCVYDESKPYHILEAKNFYKMAEENEGELTFFDEVIEIQRGGYVRIINSKAINLMSNNSEPFYVCKYEVESVVYKGFTTWVDQELINK